MSFSTTVAIVWWVIEVFAASSSIVRGAAWWWADDCVTKMYCHQQLIFSRRDMVRMMLQDNSVFTTLSYLHIVVFPSLISVTTVLTQHMKTRSSTSYILEPRPHYDVMSKQSGDWLSPLYTLHHIPYQKTRICFQEWPLVAPPGKPIRYLPSSSEDKRINVTKNLTYYNLRVLGLDCNEVS